MSHIIIGTAGHIDHGKSSLVKKLTGTDPDRLSEEQERGMTIDLGFAFLNENIAFIDVPGHEKFIKNMVAGVSTVDMAMLVIAADDGVMPQTREHLDILSLLQLQTGVVAITKIDMVDDEWVTLVEDDVKGLLAGTFLENSPLYKVSSTTGVGISELRTALTELAGEPSSRTDRGVFWMPVDRSFTIKGFGTVATGSVLSGSLKPGDSVELLPAQKPLKVRGIQAHGHSVEKTVLGDRAAINISNATKDEIKRGDVLATVGYTKPGKIFDTKLHLLKSAKKPLKQRSRIRVHIGTREILARIRPLDKDKIGPGEESFVQLLFEEDAVAMRRDPFVFRQYSPPVTIGGGTILDTNPVKRHKKFDKNVLDKLQKMEQQDPAELLLSTLISFTDSLVNIKELAKITGLQTELVQQLLNNLSEDHIIKSGPSSNPSYFHIINLNRIKDQIENTLSQFHKKAPLKPGMNKAELKNQTKNPHIFQLALKELIKENILKEDQQLIKLARHTIKLSQDDQKIAQHVNTLLLENKYSTPNEDEMCKTLGHNITDIRRVLGALQGLGDIVRLEGNIYFHKETLGSAKKMLFEFRKNSDEISVSQFREALGTTRKYAMALLGYFDEIGLTERIGEVRVINAE